MEASKIIHIDKKQAEYYVKKLVSTRFGSEIAAVKYLGGGSFGMAYKVTQNKEPRYLVAKIYKRAGMHRDEAAGLALLGQHSTIPIPKIYAIYDAKEGELADCVFMEFMGGHDTFTNFASLFKSKQKKRAFAQKVIEAMLNIHNFTNKQFGPVQNACYDSWLDYYKPFAEDVLNTAKKLKIERKLPKYIVNAMEDAYAKWDTIFCEEVREASLIHGDLNVMNIMSDKKTLEPLAIIDPLDCKFGDREYDLFQLNNLTGKCFCLYKLYKESYPVSQNCDCKCAFYALYNEVYCFIKAGTLVKFIMNPLIKDIKRQLKKL